MIYESVDGELKPYLSETGKRFKNRTHDQKRKRTKYMQSHTNYKFYGSYRWRKLAEYVKKRDPLCCECLRKYHAGKIPLEKVNLTQSVDHIVKVNDNPKLIWDTSNLQGLCNRCHRKKDGNLRSFPSHQGS